MPNVTLMGWDADAKVWRKVLVNADGKLIIDPSEIFEDPPTEDETAKAPQSKWAFDHAADAGAHHAKYTDEEARTAVGYNGTKYWSCPGLHFDASSPSEDNVTKATTGSITMVTDSIHIIAAVNLPHGAVVTGAVVYGNAGASDCTWYLRIFDLSISGYANMASATVNTADSTISYATINNSLYSYAFFVSTLRTDDIIYGAKITYTI